MGMEKENQQKIYKNYEFEIRIVIIIAVLFMIGFGFVKAIGWTGIFILCSIPAIYYGIKKWRGK